MNIWGVRFRAFCYIMLAILPVFIAAVGEVLTGKAQSCLLFWELATLNALYQMFVALRAFYDGTAQRHSDAVQVQKVENAANGVTVS